MPAGSGRPTLGQRTASSSSSGLHSYFLRSVSHGSSGLQTPTTMNASSLMTTADSSAQSSPACSQRSESPPVPAGRTLKKKSSIWSMFSRGSRKSSANAVQQQQQPHQLAQHAGNDATLPMMLANASTMSLDIPMTQHGQHGTLQGMMLMSAASSQSCTRSTGDEGLGGASYRLGQSLRSQRSLNTIGSSVSTTGTRTLRSAKSQFTLRLPAGVAHFDTDSIFSDDSEADSIGVSWITSKGARRVGLDFEDDDDADMIDLRH